MMVKVVMEAIKEADLAEPQPLGKWPRCTLSIHAPKVLGCQLRG